MAVLEKSDSANRLVSEDELKQRWAHIKTVTKEALQVVLLLWRTA